MSGQQQNPEPVQMIPNVVADARSWPSVLSNIADPRNHSSGLSRAPMPFRYLNDPHFPGLYILSRKKRTASF